MDWWYAGNLLAHTVDVMRWAWRIGAGLAAVAVVTTSILMARRRSLPPLRLAWLSLLLLNPLVMVAVVATWGCRSCPSAAAGGWTAYAPFLLLLAQVAIAGWSTWRAGPWRACVAGIHGLLIWPAICSVLVIATVS